MRTLNLNVNGENKLYDIDGYNGIKLSIIAKDFEDKFKGIITLGIIKNRLRELSYEVKEDCSIKFIDTSDLDGNRVYCRTLNLIFIMACNELYKGSKVTIEHSLANGLYCELHIGRALSEIDIYNIKNKMNEIINSDYEIEKIDTNKKDAISIFKKHNMIEKSELIEYKEYDDVKIYKCNGYIDHFYGYMLPSTGYIEAFDIKLYRNGVVLLGLSKDNKYVPRECVDQPKLANVYRESEIWSNLIGIDKVLTLNKIIENKEYGDMIRIVESLHEKKISHIADIIKAQNKRIILIAAPSSSGKTSFAHRLSIHLKVNNLNPVSISLDNYFVNREDTPIDEFGNYDFESIYAINLEQFNKDLKDLIEGREIRIPRFDFKLGKQVLTDKKLKIDKNQLIILEGIHGLNPMLTSSIDNSEKFKIYLSALTQVNLDDHNRIPTTDLRLIRRMVRDYNFRGYSAETTIMNWNSVRRGERKNIFPYQEEADVIFNSACLYELAVLKKYAKPLLEEINLNSEAYIEANRLLKLLQYFVTLEDVSDIPNTSILREFIGGSKIVD